MDKKPPKPVTDGAEKIKAAKEAATLAFASKKNYPISIPGQRT